MKLARLGWTKVRFGFLSMLILAVVLVFASCTSAPNSPTPTETPTPTQSSTPTTTQTTPAAYTVNTSTNATIGTYLVDSNGMTLYWTTRDAPGVSNISGTTLANWPVFYAATVAVPSSLNAADFGTITRSDGSQQTTYKQWPLYYYVQDKSPGDILGNGLLNVWFAVNPAGTGPVAPTTSPTPTATPTTSPTPTATPTVSATPTPSGGY